MSKIGFLRPDFFDGTAWETLVGEVNAAKNLLKSPDGHSDCQGFLRFWFAQYQIGIENTDPDCDIAQEH